MAKKDDEWQKLKKELEDLYNKFKVRISFDVKELILKNPL